MRSVFVAFDPPMPPTGGGTRTYHMLKAVADVSSCHLFLCFPISAKELSADVHKLCNAINIAQLPFSTSNRGRLSVWLHKFRMAFLPFTISTQEVVIMADYYVMHPFYVGNKLKRWLYKQIRLSLYKEARKRYAYGFQMPARALERLPQYQDLEQKLKNSLVSADLLWIDFSYPLAFFKQVKHHFPSLKVICNAHNIEYLFYERMADTANDSLQKEWLVLQSILMKQVELEGFMQCDQVVVCSEEDRCALAQQISYAKISVIPNGVDLSYFQPMNKELSKGNIIDPVILFTGTMNYRPNQDAVHYFIKSIFPQVKKIIPNCKFLIAGANASSVFSAYSQMKDVELVSSPADIRPYYNMSSVVVVPLKSGGGTRLKILEAAAMMKPIVSTSIGAEGLDMSNDIDLLIADKEDDFSNKLLSVLSNPEKYKPMVESAFASVKFKYNWITIRSKISSLLKSLM